MKKKWRLPKRIFIVHGWGGSPYNDWLPWAKYALADLGYTVTVPLMPDPDNPKIGEWVPFLKKMIIRPNWETVLIGHSLGCKAVLLYLQSLAYNQVVDKVILVAGRISGESKERLTLGEQALIKPWNRIDWHFDQIKEHLVNGIYAILSDNDTNVDLKENKKAYEEKLGAEVIIQKRMGHFKQDDNVNELPILLDLVGKKS